MNPQDDLISTKELIRIGKKIIDFIDIKFKIDNYQSTNYTLPNGYSALKIVFDYQFYIIYNLESKELIRYNYDEDENENLTKSFKRYLKINELKSF
jgi:hypothetical protein